MASAVGFWTKSTAPASSAVRTSSPDSLATLTMTIGHRPPRHLLADEPDAVEVRHDQVAGDDVGLELATSSSASRPSRAVPTTSMNGLRDSICVTTLRT